MEEFHKRPTFDAGRAASAFKNDWIHTRRNIARDPFEATRATADCVASTLDTRVRTVGPGTT